MHVIALTQWFLVEIAWMASFGFVKIGPLLDAAIIDEYWNW